MRNFIPGIAQYSGTVSDLSRPVENDSFKGRLCHGTAGDILRNVNGPDARALNVLDLPMENGPLVPTFLASDMWAWTHTVGKALSKRGDRYPGAAMRWALVSTADTYSPWHIDCDGLATMIEVQTGCKWWVVARPKEGDNSAFARMDTFRDFDVAATNEDRWDCEAVLLTPGTCLYVLLLTVVRPSTDTLVMNFSFLRPNTPHCVFTPEPTICYGGHFFATSTIMDTCYGIYNSFSHGQLTNTEHEAESRELLRRLVAWSHSRYVLPGYPGMRVTILSPCRC